MIVVVGEPSGTPQSARMLHRILIAGLLVVVALFLLIAIGLHGAPLMTRGHTASIVGYLMAACAAAPIVLGVLILKPRVPSRAAGADDRAFWQAASGPVIAVWVVLEGGGIIAAVGALLTGSLAPVLALVIAIGSLAVLGPSHFENA